MSWPVRWPASWSSAGTELTERLDVIGRLDAAIGPIKQRRRGHTAGEVLVGVAAAQLAPVPGLAATTAASLIKNFATSFNLIPDRPEDRPAIAALQASSARLLDEPQTAAAQRNVRHVVRQLLSRHSRKAA